MHIVKTALLSSLWIGLIVFGAAADEPFSGLLQPGQILGNNGTAPAAAAPITPWKGAPPPGRVHLFASPSGNDTNNCLSSDQACTLKGACSVRSAFATFMSGPISIALANGTYSATDADNALCTVIGNIGGSSSALTSIRGDCTTPTNVILAVPNNGIGIYVKDGGEAGINCLEFTGGNNSIGIDNAGQGAVVDMNDIYWGTWGTGGSHVALEPGAYGNLIGSGETLLANFTHHWNLSGGAFLTAGAPSNIPSVISWAGGDWLAAQNGYINLVSWTFTGSGVAGSTGGKANLSGPGYLITAGARPCRSAFPGSGDCSLTFGFQDNAGDGIASGRNTLPTVNGTPFTAGPVAVDNTHCGWIYALGGGAFYTANVPSASAFSAGCKITIADVDISACKGKSISVDGFSAHFVLWPGQTVEFTNVDNAWVETVNPGRWRPNCGGRPLIINTDSTNGTDTAGVSDGLGTGIEAFKSVNGAIGYVLTDFDFSGAPQTQVKILMAASSLDSAVVHYAPHASNAGANGGAALTIDGNGGSLTGGVQFYYGAIVRIRNVTLSNADGSCLVSTQNAYVQILDLVSFGACSKSQVAVSNYGSVELLGDFAISGGGTYFISNQGGTVLEDGGTIAVSNSVTYSGDVVYGYAPGRTALSAAKWSLGGNTVTGKKYDVGGNHLLDGAANIPGTVGGTTANGGQAM